jgi:hypothetical protein
MGCGVGCEEGRGEGKEKGEGRGTSHHCLAFGTNCSLVTPFLSLTTNFLPTLPFCVQGLGSP